MSLGILIFTASFIVAYIAVYVLSGDPIIGNTTTALQWFIAGNKILEYKKACQRVLST